MSFKLDKAEYDARWRGQYFYAADDFWTWDDGESFHETLWGAMSAYLNCRRPPIKCQHVENFLFTNPPQRTWKCWICGAVLGEGDK